MTKFNKFRNRKKHYLNVESQVTNLFMTFYPEQVISPKFRSKLFPSNQSRNVGTQISDADFWNTPVGVKIVSACKDHLKKMIVVSKNEWTIALICHDKDMTVDENDKMKSKHKKTHFHTVMWRNDGKRFRVRKALQILDLNFDGVLDANIMDNTFSYTRNVKNALQYLLHMTEQSEEDGKAPYSRDELITNITDEELDKIYHAETKDKLSNDDWDNLAQKAYSCGLNLHDFRTFAERHFSVRQQSQAPFKIVKRYYDNGLFDAIAKAEDFPRLNIILRGTKNTGKSYSTQKVLNNMGYRIYKPVSGTGKYDGLSSSDTAMLFDDKNASQILSICSDSPTLLHRRNSGYAPWTGNTTVMLTNKSFTQYIKSSARDDIHTENGQVIDDDKDVYNAMISRFYFCEVVWPDFQPQDFGVDHSRDAYIKVVKKYDRGTKKDKEIHDRMFYQLIRPIENEIKNYYQLKYNEFWNEYHDENHQKNVQQVVSSDDTYHYYFDYRKNTDKSNENGLGIEDGDDNAGIGVVSAKELDELADSFGIEKGTIDNEDNEN